MKKNTSERNQRLAAALRENLRKRKARERALAPDAVASSRDSSGTAGGRGPSAAKKDS